MARLSTNRVQTFAALLMVLSPLPACAAADLHDLYNSVLSKGHAVMIPAKVLGRLKLGAPSSDIPAKEIVVSGSDQEQRGITAFELAGVPTLTMFHVEPDKDDSWLTRLSLDGQILNQEWEQGGYRTYEMHAPQVAEGEIDFWRRRMGK